jgi:hypothetical protein
LRAGILLGLCSGGWKIAKNQREGECGAESIQSHFEIPPRASLIEYHSKELRDAGRSG